MNTDFKSIQGATVDELFQDVYQDLRVLAVRAFDRENTGHTLQATALVHEVYMRLAKQVGYSWNSRSEFVAVASLMIRRVLVDHARRVHAARRPNPEQRVSFVNETSVTSGSPIVDDLLTPDDALDRLEEFDIRKARIVQMRFFGGLTVNEVASVLDLSPRAIAHDWAVARAWLHREMEAGEWKPVNGSR